MRKIKVMNEKLASLIAAGEVVESPLSVVKELIENSIDAEATSIRIELIESGMGLIKVVDNGLGMSRSDVEKCLLRHASSKVYDESDLNTITTLGFRGEALAAIAAVSEIIISSCDGTNSTKLFANAGVVGEITSTTFRKGTIVEVKNLFYNTPARLKYIVNLYTELAKISDFVTRIALAYPNISFLLINDDKELIKTSISESQLKTISEVYGSNTAKLMDYLQFNNQNYEIEMYISKTQMQRASRKYINIFVNGRYIQSTYLTKALIKVYHNYIPSSRFPLAVINIKCDPSLIDVNIHPHKTEIKFSMSTALKDLLVNEVSKHLSSYTHEVRVASDYDEKITFEQLPLERIFEKVSEVDTTTEENIVISQPSQKFLNVIGQLYGTYILAQNDEGFYIIDQHAAQERINYEKLRKSFNEEEVYKTDLLMPITLEYPLHEYEKLVKKLDEVRELGIGIETFGVNAFVVREVPTWIIKDFEEEIVSIILESLLNNQKITLLDLLDDIIETISCRSSIKANDRLSLTAMEKLLDDLFACDDPYHCPHKRPTVIVYSKENIEKMFMRIM